MVFLKVLVPRLLPSQLVEPVSPQPRGQRLYGNFLGHVHITALSRSRRRASTCPRFAAAQNQQRRATPQRHSFGWPELTVKPSATLPPCSSTRRISLSPARASGHACIELIASALSNVSSANGSLSTEP